MTYSWQASREAFSVAAHWFVETAGLVGDRWSAPGLGEWDVRALVGHTSRSFLTVETYLGQPSTTVDIPSPADYYRATSAMSVGPEVSERGRAAGSALGDDPAGAVAEIAARVLPLVESQDGSALLTTIAGGMRLSDYLPTRTFELTVHTADLATAWSLPVTPPPAAARQVMHLVSDLAIETDVVGAVLLALTGRRGLPAGFSVL
jgi:uncharacterized protein (TIGR03083 family)